MSRRLAVKKTCNGCGKTFRPFHRDQKHCSRKCVHPSDERRFMSFVNTEGDNGCWLWTGGTSSGKGTRNRAMFWFRGTTTHASRVAWILFQGDPGDKWVLHTCDNELCVNPEHLYLGNHADNMKDRAERHPNSFVKGESHGNAKLTKREVAEIQNKYEPYKYSQQKLASEYGVARTTIQQIVEGRNWKHV